MTYSNFTNTSRETSSSVLITSNSINNKDNLYNLNDDLDLFDNFEFDTSDDSSGDEFNNDKCFDY